MRKIFKLRSLPYYLIVLFLGLKILSITQDFQTTGVTITPNGQNLECEKSIIIEDSINISDYIQNKPPIHGLQSQICTYNHIYNGSDSDRVHLLKFSEGLLENGFQNRPDIAKYFYRKIIDANPDDTLSLYIKTYKLDDRK